MVAKERGEDLLAEAAAGEAEMAQTEAGSAEAGSVADSVEAASVAVKTGEVEVAGLAVGTRWMQSPALVGQSSRAPLQSADRSCCAWSRKRRTLRRRALPER